MAHNDDESKFEVTQILASRRDRDGDEWLLVQWGCTWVLRTAMAEGPLLDDFVSKAKLIQSMQIPIEAGSQTEADAAAHSRRKETADEPSPKQQRESSEH